MAGPKFGSNSQAQRNAERLIFARVERELGCALTENPVIPLPDSSCAVVPDFYCEEPPVAGEIFAHVGPLKAGQRHKLAGDILKLLLLERATGRTLQKVLALCDPEVERSLRGDSWLAECIRQFDVRVIRVELEDEALQKLREAQARQIMVSPEALSAEDKK